MAEAWGRLLPTKIGGPAYDDPGGDFVPGMYLKRGNVITSRGCPRRCWFCLAARREGKIRELPITEGWNVHDNNLLACSEEHVKNVFAMLKTQPEPAAFTGGLDTKLMRPWIADLLVWLKPRSAFFAYDTPDDRDPLDETARMLRAAGFPFNGHALACFVLIGYPGDTFERAEERLWFVAEREIMPYAMLYRPPVGEMNKSWQSFQREWCHTMIAGMKVRHFAKTGERLAIDTARTQPKRKAKGQADGEPPQKANEEVGPAIPDGRESYGVDEFGNQHHGPKRK